MQEEPEIADQLEQLGEKSERHFQDCEIHSAMRIAKEATRIAKSHQLVVHYMRGLFDQMRFGHGLLDPVSTREVSVELVVLLQDEDQARKIQPALDEGHYEWLCSWMSSCAYDNLAEATGSIAGFNSPGMHDCISEGIQVCRQTGKLECIKCFREYASDVYLSLDDFDMVRHQCSSLLQHNPDHSDDKDRRWSGHHKLAKLLILEGRLDRALEELEQAMLLSQAENVYLKRRAKLLVAATLDEVSLLSNQSRFHWDSIQNEIPAPGEWPYFELQCALNQSLGAVIDKEFPTAIDLLTDWDRRLTEQNCLKDWFEVRLRLIAAYLLNDDRKRAAALAKGLEAKAHDAQDYLTLRRLKSLLDGAHDVSPIAGFRAVQLSVAESSANSDANRQTPDESESDADNDSVTPLGEFIAESMRKMVEAEEGESREEVLESFLGLTPAEVEDPRDASYLVHLCQFLVQGTEQAKRAWTWARELLAKFPDDAKLLSVIASLGHYFRTADPTEFDEITTEQLQKWFHLSASLNVDDPQNFARAGRFHYDEGNHGEAERCFSRAFRLARTDASVVIPLSDLYRESERPRDALAVLDLSLREGCDNQEVAWEAAMTALQLEQFESLLTYIDRFLELGEPQPWANYYRAVALWHLGQFEESLEAIENESEFELPGSFHLDMIRLCNLIELQRVDSARILFDKVLSVQLSTLDYLSYHGILRLFGQLWSTVQDWADDDRHRQQLEKRMLVAGLTPDDFFDQRRRAGENVEDVAFYRVLMRQALDTQWPQSAGCLPGQQAWTEYETDWGVLAKSDEEAVDLALSFQSQCFHLPAEILDVVADDQHYRDFAGVAWQGMRWSDSDTTSAEDSLFENDDDE